MKLFDSVQKVVYSGGGKVKITVPPSYSIILTNKTDDTIFIFPDYGTKVGYPLLRGEVLELENITVTSTFYGTIADSETTDNKGLFILARPWISRQQIEENNVTIFNKDKE
ncbi:hypothetical protein L3073_06035 [Ancylomarina sp. DW003]|nr:hypothetical protein [Ancylomarina sp. DW003]MDE5421760.1 hypothetical protein [Ancylomarina sp. DW003]